MVAEASRAALAVRYVLSSACPARAPPPPLTVQQLLVRDAVGLGRQVGAGGAHGEGGQLAVAVGDVGGGVGEVTHGLGGEVGEWVTKWVEGRGAWRWKGREAGARVPKTSGTCVVWRHGAGW